MFLIAVFLITIASVPVIQFAAEWLRARPSACLPMFDIFKTISAPGKFAAARSLRDVWNLLPHAEQLKGAERALESDSIVSQWLLPSVQSFLVGTLGAGNEQVYPGRDGWLFYRPDVDYVTGPGFLEPAQLRQRRHAARIQPDPVQAIVQFRDQLAARGIELIVFPVPRKPRSRAKNSVRGRGLTTLCRTLRLPNSSAGSRRPACACSIPLRCS